jgi:hypothetical protein
MKKFLLIACSAFAVWSAQAQPVINSADYNPTADSIFNYKYGVVQVNPGPAGANVTWDNSAINLTTNYPVIPHVCPGSAECSNFASATEYMETNLPANVFYQRTQTTLAELGVVNGSGGTTTYTPAYTFLEFPITYNQTYADAYTATLLQNGMTTSQSGTYTGTVDAYGTLKTPAGTFTDVLRQKRIDIATINAGTATVTTTITQYDWLKAGVNQPLMTIIITDVVLSGGLPSPPTSYVATYLQSIPAGINEQADLDRAISIYPNPVAADQTIHISVKDYQVSRITLSNMMGQELFKWNNKETDKNAPLMLPISTATLAKGIYLLTINTTKGSLTKKISIQ